MILIKNPADLKIYQQNRKFTNKYENKPTENGLLIEN